MSTSQNPTVSVILSVRNGEPYLREAIESILAQSFRDFELIVVDNYSKDRSAEIVKSYEDERIILIRPDKPLHLAQALNYAGSMVRGELIARMDADDICHHQRFEQQVQFMREHPNVGILGTQIRPIDGDGRPITSGDYLRPEAHADIATGLFFGCPVWHPTVMFRKDVVNAIGWYGSPAIAGREEYSAEDYDLWCRAIKHTQIHNHPEILLDYRIHAANHSMGDSMRGNRLKNAASILSQYIKDSLGIDVPPAQCAPLRGFMPNEIEGEGDSVIDVHNISGLIRPILDLSIRNGISDYGLKKLRDKISRIYEVVIWNRGYNVMRESTALIGVDWQIGIRVLIASLRRFI